MRTHIYNVNNFPVNVVMALCDHWYVMLFENYVMIDWVLFVPISTKLLSKHFIIVLYVPSEDMVLYYANNYKSFYACYLCCEFCNTSYLHFDYFVHDEK